MKIQFDKYANEKYHLKSRQQKDLRDLTYSKRKWIHSTYVPSLHILFRLTNIILISKGKCAEEPAAVLTRLALNHEMLIMFWGRGESRYFRGFCPKSHSANKGCKSLQRQTRGSLSLYSWYAWDRGQIPNMAVTGPNR